MRAGLASRCWASLDPLPCPSYTSACSCGLASKGQDLSHTCDCHSQPAANGALITERRTATPPWSVSLNSRGGLNTEQFHGRSRLRRGHAVHSSVALGPLGTGDGPFCGGGLAAVHAHAVTGASAPSASSVGAAGSAPLLLLCGPPEPAPFPLWPHLCDHVARKRGGGTKDGENFKT